MASIDYVGLLLPPANEVWGKVIFSQVSVILSTGGCAGQWACMAVGAWQGVCVAGCGWVWQGWVCVVGGVHGRETAWQGHVWWGHVRKMPVSKQAVLILLECFLVLICHQSLCQSAKWQIKYRVICWYSNVKLLANREWMQWLNCTWFYLGWNSVSVLYT